MHKYTTEEFVKKANLVHGNRYDYSRVQYIDSSKTKVQIICPEHGPFRQLPNNHLFGQRCPQCGHNAGYQARRSTTKDFIRKAIAVHGKEYNYSTTEYSCSKSKVTIICSLHGPFQQIATDHLSGKGCAKCGNSKKTGRPTKTTKQFAEEASRIHHGRYSYNKTVYTGCYIPVKIACPEHGLFVQAPHSHLQGVGCPYCQESKGENKIAHILDNWKIPYHRQYRFPDCRDKLPLPFDFFLDYNNHAVLIEYQGEQHFSPVNHWKGRTGLITQRHRDAIKAQYANDHNVPLIIIPYTIKDIKQHLQEQLTNFLPA